jgi:hypothetical protein
MITKKRGASMLRERKKDKKIARIKVFIRADAKGEYP